MSDKAQDCDGLLRRLRFEMRFDGQLGEVLRHARMARGLKLADLANAIGVGRQMVGKYESGAVSMPIGTLIVLAALCRRDWRDLIAEALRGSSDIKQSDTTTYCGVAGSTE